MTANRLPHAQVGSPKTQQLACSTLVVLLRQCSASMAARARRLVLPLVCLVRESACPLEMRRDAASCLERLTKERGMRVGRLPPRPGHVWVPT